MKKYYVNNNQTSNPGLHHEVHTKEHSDDLEIVNKTYLGEFSNCIEAVEQAKKIYYDADGCEICCKEAHEG